VRPLLKSFVGCRVAWEVAELCLKFGFNVHRGLIVRGHTVSLYGSEKMRADAVRMAVSILQGWVIVLCGRQVVDENRGAEILKGMKKNAVQEDLKAPVHESARCLGGRRIRCVSFALGFVVDQTPVAAVGLIADDVFEASEHGSEQKFEAQEG
jgi:hypothetical protein